MFFLLKRAYVLAKLGQILWKASMPFSALRTKFQQQIGVMRQEIVSARQKEWGYRVIYCFTKERSFWEGIAFWASNNIFTARNNAWSK